jgi:hypothetical protein
VADPVVTELSPRSSHAGWFFGLDASRAEVVAKGGLDVVVAAMARFASTALVQAAGCRFVSIVSAKDGTI